MERLDIFIEKLNRIIPGRLFGLFSITAGILGDIIALLMYPLMEYDFIRNAVSTLCEGPGGIFFNAGNIFSGLFALIFVNYLGKTFNEENINRTLKRGVIICANISCSSFILLGVFCGSEPVAALIHGTSAAVSWIFGIFYISFFNVLFIKSNNYSRYLGYFGFITTVSLSLMMIFFTLHFVPIFRFLMVVLPSLEWLNTLAVIVWYLVVSIYIIVKHRSIKDDE